MNKKHIIHQTPSHLGLFEKVTVHENVTNIRDGLKEAGNYTTISNQFYKKENIERIISEIKTHFLQVHNYNVIPKHEKLVKIVVNNVFIKTYGLEENIRKMNMLVVKKSIAEIHENIVGHEKYMKDKNSIQIMDRGVLTSNKIEKQLPKYNLML